MPRNVFLSFVEEDISLANLFRGQAKNENNELEFSDFSVKEPFNSTNADYIRQQINALIKRVSVTLCLFGETTYKSRWVDWEVQTSAEMGKGLVGVRPHSSWKDIPPTVLKDNNTEIVD
jgi:hypothetical protein